MDPRRFVAFRVSRRRRRWSIYLDAFLNVSEFRMAKLSDGVVQIKFQRASDRPVFNSNGRIYKFIDALTRLSMDRRRFRPEFPAPVPEESFVTQM